MSRERERFDEIGKKIKREQADAAAAAAASNSHNNNLIMGRRHMLGPPGTLNTITPCAACKLLRRRCAQECPFSPYFSPHEPQKFASVHKVFGASNVSKMLMEVPETQRADAANSLVYEANVRLRDPVYGCMGAISALQQQVQALQAELNAIRVEILKYKYSNINNLTPTSTSHHQHQHHHHHVALLSSGAVSVAAPPPQQPPTPPPPRPQSGGGGGGGAPPPVQSDNLPSSSSSSSMYTQQPTSTTTAADYSNISNDNVSSYFG